MNVNSGNTYPSLSEALVAGEDPAEMVEVTGSPEAVEQMSVNLKDRDRRRAANKRARRSRRKNRR